MVVMITGAARGIGAAYAKGFAAEGARVSLCDLKYPNTVVEEIAEAGGHAIGFGCDVTDKQAVDAMVAKTVRAFGSIHVLINNAGLFATIPLKGMSEIASDEWDRIMAVNVRGSFECARAVLPLMRAQKYGKIINTASGTVYRGLPRFLHYVASKGAVIAMTRAMARELGDDGIRVNCVAPGLTLSDGVVDNRWADSISDAIRNSRCLKRDQMPEDLVGTMLFLAGPESDFITGQTLIVDGGGSMN
ncbi:MAG: SDR family NAD(P)-dependent oxidoreductase [Pseudorhodoplanes sp.]|uniref:SDR family NAD(P)-dependent oxidoreductase n=1 Tax=Pseudorhodoplanes sp. TaxID=1934341 RepID=UPI003D09B208